MKKLLLTKTRWLVTIILLLSVGVSQVWAGDVTRVANIVSGNEYKIKNWAGDRWMVGPTTTGSNVAATYSTTSAGGTNFTFTWDATDEKWTITFTSGNTTYWLVPVTEGGKVRVYTTKHYVGYISDYLTDKINIGVDNNGTGYNIRYNSQSPRFGSYSSGQNYIKLEEATVVPVTGVEVSPTSKAIFIGETFTVTPTVSPSNASNKNVNWASSASGKASVNSSGVVTGVATGSANITATSAADGTKSATCAVTVYSVTIQVQDEDGNTLSGSGMPTASPSGRNITADEKGNKYVFKEWQTVTAAGTTISSTSNRSTSLTGTPTGNVTVKAVYYKPISVTWSIPGNSNYTTGDPTNSVGYNEKVTTLPTAPNPASVACDGTTFMGWTASPMGATLGQDAPSDLFKTAGSSPAITTATTFYAVFADPD